jgi:hypothetical protein
MRMPARVPIPTRLPAVFRRVWFWWWLAGLSIAGPLWAFAACDMTNYPEWALSVPYGHTFDLMPNRTERRRRPLATSTRLSQLLPPTQQVLPQRGMAVALVRPRLGRPQRFRGAAKGGP